MKEILKIVQETQEMKLLETIKKKVIVQIEKVVNSTPLKN